MIGTVHNTPKAKLHIRWMIRKDLEDVLEIERACFEFPWGSDEFITTLRQRDCLAQVIETDAEIVV